jgi:hypothetical protein
MSTIKTKYHKDGDVTIFNIFSQSWEKKLAVLVAKDDRLMSSINDGERAKIRAHAAKRGVWMNLSTGSFDEYDGWYYENEDGETVNAVELGEVEKVTTDKSGNWVAA